METLKITSKKTSQTNFVTCVGNITGVEAFDFKSKLQKASRDEKNVCIDLMKVDEISLTGLNAMILSKAYSSLFDKDVILILPKESKVLQLLHQTKMEDQFNIVLRSKQEFALAL